jgi:hypothetical protein
VKSWTEFAHIGQVRLFTAGKDTNSKAFRPGFQRISPISSELLSFHGFTVAEIFLKPR